VSANAISAPGTAKHREHARDTDRHQARTGEQWYFGMNLHINLDSKTRLVQSTVATAASFHESRVLADLLHGEESRVPGDSACTGQQAITHATEKNAAGETRLFRPGGGNARGRALLTGNPPGRPGFA
jgi:IS5 family transposase